MLYQQLVASWSWTSNSALYHNTYGPGTQEFEDLQALPQGTVDNDHLNFKPWLDMSVCQESRQFAGTVLSDEHRHDFCQDNESLDEEESKGTAGRCRWGRFQFMEKSQYSFCMCFSNKRITGRRIQHRVLKTARGWTRSFAYLRTTSGLCTTNHWPFSLVAIVLFSRSLIYPSFSLSSLSTLSPPSHT